MRRGSIRLTLQVRTTPATRCDCCGNIRWSRLFSDGGFDLGRCTVCNLHYITPMPPLEQRMTELEAGHFVEVDPEAKRQHHGEAVRSAEMESYLDAVRQFAPAGLWLDIGCGVGVLLTLAQRAGREVAGIELSPERRALARQTTGATIYDRPLEYLDITPDSVAVATLINVFSHLVSPSETLRHIRRVLMPGGIVLLRTGEIGPQVMKHHVFTWGLGDHLHFLGDGTIDRYARKLGFEIVMHDKTWLPVTVYSREWFRMKGPSKLRNLTKGLIRGTPGALRLLRWYMLRIKHTGNPVFTSTIVLRRKTT
jgi:SAM-dependent methyltransferase